MPSTQKNNENFLAVDVNPASVHQELEKKDLEDNKHGSTPPNTIHKSDSQPKLSGSLRSITQVIQAKLSGRREEGDYTVGCMKLFHTRTRFALMVLVLLCLASVWSNILCFNFATICINSQAGIDAEGAAVDPEAILGMVSDQLASNQSSATDSAISLLNGDTSTIHPAKPLNTTVPISKALFNRTQRFWITSSVAIAALISNFIVVSLVNQFGIRCIFSLLGLLSAISTCLMPAAIELGFYYILANRVLQGIAFAANFPVIGSFTSKWTYYKQNGLFVSALWSSMFYILWLASVFYAHGGYSAFLFTLFAIFFRNSPGKHPFVGEVELRKIAVGKSELNKEILKKIPYREILKTASVWAIWIAAIGNFFCVNMMFLYSPQYLNSVLHYSVAHTGFSASLAPLAQFTIKLLAGFTSDKVTFFYLPNYSCLFPYPVPNNMFGILGISAGLLGFTTGGFFKAGPLVSKHYSHFVTGNVSLGITITMLLVPGMVTGIAPNNTAAEWRLVFLMTAAVLVITNLMFAFMCSADPASWTTDEFSRNASRNKIHAIQTNNVKEFAPEVSMG
uniref:Uncharacterized protein n=1 Tax=Ditylenchus dipsaci TaxID=166011 RepID=A0A915DNC8_9BILA